ncbi:hypothetical protein B0H16DRAFT_1699419, partial [Mycena metata]
MPFDYSLLVQSADGISWNPGPLHRKNPKFYVAICVDGTQIHRTHSVKGDPGPKWDRTFMISSDSASASISLRLFHDSLVGDTFLGAANIDMATLADLCGAENESKVVNLDLIGVQAKLHQRSVGNLTVRLMKPREGAALAINKIQTGAEATGPGVSITAFGAGRDAVEAGGGILVQVTPISSTIASALESVTSRLEIIVKIGDQIATIHPYANIAWKVLTAVYKTVKQQQDTDEKLLELIDTMNEVYSFVGDVDFLVEKIRSVEEKTLTIVKQTVECALFIQEYTARGFTSRAIRSTWNDAEKNIDKLSTTMRDMKRSFEGDLTVQCLFLSAKVLNVVKHLDESDMLRKLNPVDMNATSRTLCSVGTRRQILDNIIEWATVPSDSGNVLWLSGVAGSGKSTISTTISESLRGLERLGAFLFFDRNDRARSHPDAVIRTIAYWLALSNPHIGSAVSAAIRRDPAVVNAPLQTQFKCLLLNPLQLAEQHIQGPLIVILDALDECGDPDSRLPLLSLLSEELPKLPHFLRVFVTSRRDSDITNHFGTCFEQRFLDTGASSSEDVEAFVRQELTRIPGLPLPEEKNIKALVELSGGLFIWASTAMKYLKSYRPKDRLRVLLTQDSSSDVNLDTLYSVALRDSAAWKTDKDFAQDAHSVLVCVVLGRVPMTDTTIDMILSFEEGTSANILAHLGCVVQWSQGGEARTLHASFADYLIDTTRSGTEPWSIDPETDHHLLAQGCLQILNSQLKFNICSLEDSHCLNADIPDLHRRVASNIPPHLDYSSRFWFNHVRNGPSDTTVLNRMRQFLYENLLYWLEVLSLLGHIPIATEGLRTGIEY